MSENAKIKIENFNFHFKDKHVIHDLNLEIPANKITAIFGPANSGVTTLFRSLNRLCDLDDEAKPSGDIYLNGDNIFDPTINVTELRRKVGMVFEVPTPLPMSIYDNVAFGPRLRGNIKEQDLKNLVEESLKMAALWEDVKDRLSSAAMSLSGGQQQRLCIARVLALQPEVIILDRACSGLDPISTAKIEESLRNLKEKYTIIVAPHNVKQAARLSDQTCFMLMGDLIEVGETKNLFAYPQDKRTHDYITGRFG